MGVGCGVNSESKEPDIFLSVMTDMAPKAPAARSGASKKGVVAVVAKVPHPGRSKTRLIGVLGPHGAATLAEALLKDVVTSLDRLDEDCDDKVTGNGGGGCHKVLLYAPHTDEALQHLQHILLQIGHCTTRNDTTTDQQPFSGRLATPWHLLPLPKSDPTYPNLSIPLTASAQLLQQHYPDAASLVFVGMDAPELPLNEVRAALCLPSGWAHLCPASDGGYGLLGVSTTTRRSNNNNHDHDWETSHAKGGGGTCGDWFDGVLWSHPLTALSQLKALQESGFDTIRLGQLVHDVDDESDVTALCQRLQQQQHQQQKAPLAEYGCLDRMSAEAAALATADNGTTGEAKDDFPPCTYTRRALTDLGLLVRDS